MKRTFLFAALAAAVVAGPASAQLATGPVRSNTSGFLLGFGVNASTIKAQDPEIASGTKGGGGIFLQLGYGFTPHFTLYTELAGASLNDDGDGSYPNSKAGVGHFDLGARYHFGNRGWRARPFLQAAVGVRAVTHDNVEYEDMDGFAQTGVLTYGGGAASVGAGLLYAFTPGLSLHTSVEASAGKFTSVTLGDITDHNQSITATSARLNVGLNWFPSRPR